MVKEVQDDYRDKELTAMLPMYIAKYGNAMSTDLIIQGVVTAYDDKEDVDCLDEAEPKTTATDNCLPKSACVKIKERPPPQVIAVGSEETSPGLRNLSLPGTGRLNRTFDKKMSLFLNKTASSKSNWALNQTQNFKKYSPRTPADPD